MHRYMRAVGFSEELSRQKLKELMKKVVVTSDQRDYTLNLNEEMLGDISKCFAKNLGIQVCGSFDDEDKYIYDYYFPYIKGTGITSFEEVSVERHASNESFCGICDEVNAGLSIIFFLGNRIPYIKANYTMEWPMSGLSVTLAGLSVKGVILFPIKKDEMQMEKRKQEIKERHNLLIAARKGDEDAIETLTLEDMDLFSAVSKQARKEDIYSIVDSYFMPCGVECDHYNVLGDIVACEKTQNIMTQEEIYLLTICCNELTFDVAINIMDLIGEPAVGRRFKGIIWLQGVINYPENIE